VIDPRDIRLKTLPELQKIVADLGEPAFRAKQLQEWLWKKQANSFEEMSNLSKGLRTSLEQSYDLNKVTVYKKQKSNDGTIKFGFKLADGNLVEGVLIPSLKRVTACVSSQVGCSLTCKFCATGYMDLKRNLLPYEIYDQVSLIQEEAIAMHGRTLSNIVYMGMGEPLLNFKNVVDSIRKITGPEGMAMAPKRITVSTAGIAKMIMKYADEGLKTEFALSLHAANDEKRSKIMPINEHNDLPSLIEALKYFYEKTGTRITYEYLLFEGFNDSLEDAKELYEFWKIVPAKINIIEYNPISMATFKNTDAGHLERFIALLENRGVVVNVRRSRGKDVDAACGQLAIKEA